MMDQSLSNFIDEACGENRLRVEDDLGDGFVRLRVSEAERRQAVHDIRSSEDIAIELLRNARDANASTIFLSTCKIESTRSLVILDDGDGVPEGLHHAVFEPRVTSKLDSAHVDKWGVHGRGMALYSISVNADEAYIASSAPGKGSSFVVRSHVERVGERADQSTFPAFLKGEGNVVSVRGPRNILRTACEFALDCRDRCSVYFGSPVEVAATLYAFGKGSLSPSVLAFCANPDDVPVVKRLSVASTPAEFASLAQGIGLDMSQRSARRIIDGDIKPLPSLLDRVKSEGFQPAAVKGSRTSTAGAPQTETSSLVARKSTVRFAQRDIDEFQDRIRAALAPLAKAYYLETSVSPTIKVRNGELKISIPLVDDDS